MSTTKEHVNKQIDEVLGGMSVSDLQEGQKAYEAIISKTETSLPELEDAFKAKQQEAEKLGAEKLKYSAASDATLLRLKTLSTEDSYEQRLLRRINSEHLELDLSGIEVDKSEVSEDQNGFFLALTNQLQFLGVKNNDQFYTTGSLKSLLEKLVKDEGSALANLVQGIAVYQAAIQDIADLLKVSFHIYKQGDSRQPHCDMIVSPSPRSDSVKWINLLCFNEEGAEHYSSLLPKTRDYVGSKTLGSAPQKVGTILDPVQFLKDCATMSQDRFDAIVKEVKEKAAQPRIRLTLASEDRPIVSATLSSDLCRIWKARDLNQALRRAAVFATIEDFKQLLTATLSAQIDINAQDDNPKGGYTALHVAILNGRTDNALYLLEKGARYDITDKSGKTAVDYMAVKSNTVLLNKIREIEASTATAAASATPSRR